jgi:hypothetical protein
MVTRLERADVGEDFSSRAAYRAQNAKGDR